MQRLSEGDRLAIDYIGDNSMCNEGKGGFDVTKELVKKVQKADELLEERDRLQVQVQGLEDRMKTLESRNESLRTEANALKTDRDNARLEKSKAEQALKQAESDLAVIRLECDGLKKDNKKLGEDNKQLEEDNKKLEEDNKKLRKRPVPSHSKSGRASAVILYIAVFLVFLPFSRPLQSLYGVLQISDYSWFLTCLNLFIALQLGLCMIWVYSKIKKA